MGVKRVSASDFRVHLKTYANLIASGHLEVVMERHGYPMAAMVNLEEYEEFCRWKAAQGGGKKEQPAAAPEGLAAAGADATGPQTPAAVSPATVPSAGAVRRGRLHVPTSALSTAEVVMYRTHPEAMDTDLVERLYQETRGTTNELIERWRDKAYFHLQRCGRPPDHDPFETMATRPESP